MKSYTLLFTLIIIGTMLLVLSSCEEKDNNDNITREKVTGYVQKGPFINGTQILMSELNASMEQTGKIFSSQINNDKGSFEVNNVKLYSCYVELSANGYYFDEVGGEISSGPLTLYALSDLTDIATVNVNILTHLEKQRVNHLVKNNKMSLESAKGMAQSEILAIFGFQKDEMMNSEDLNISLNGDDHAILLAISIILQGKRSAGDLTELLATISNDIKEDGVLSDDDILDDLRSSTLELNLDSIRQNLERRFQTLGESASVPDFETYIGYFFAYTAQVPIVYSSNADTIGTHGATLVANVNPSSATTSVNFEYGSTTAYGTTVSAIESPVSGQTNQEVSAIITGLEPGLSYHFRVKAENEFGVTYGKDISFTTHGDAPIASELDATNITNTGALIRASVNPNYLSCVVSFEYGTTTEYGESIPASQSPINGNASTVVSVNISDLEPGTTYHFRVRAENELGVSYGNDVTFNTSSHGIVGSVTDEDGNTYGTIGIDRQVWMSVNLKTTLYNDGTAIPFISDSLNWALDSEPAYCWYRDNEAMYKDTYGALYNWATVNTNKLCPVGWRVPSKSDWDQLVEFIIAEGNDVGMSLRAESGWVNDENGTNDYGFTALPGGHIIPDAASESYLGAEWAGYWWSTTEWEHNGDPDYNAYILYIMRMSLDNDDWDVNIISYPLKNGFSVRCIKE